MRCLEPTAISLWLLFLGWNIALLGSAASSNRQASVCLEDLVLRSSKSIPSSDGWRLYDPDPNHLWNRLCRSLYRREWRDGRQYGYDELDPLLWHSTKYLLINPSYRQVVTLLDEFLTTHAERAITNPLKRAIFQRDLWAIFDWTTEVSNDSQEKLNLQIKLVQVMKRLALSPDQIAALPNTYKEAVNARAFATTYDLDKPEQAFLPPDLFDPQGPWVRLSARGGSPVAPSHVQGFSGRSVFLVFMHLPEGRDATLKYLKKLSQFPRPWIPDPQDPRRLLPNSNLPQFPVGTQLALVRGLVLIDSRGEFRSTNIVEDIQIRVHRTIPGEIPDALNTNRNEAREALDVHEFKLSRSKLFTGESGGLRAIAAGETEFPLFQSQGIDLFEQPLVELPPERELRVSLDACSSCHFRPGVHSVLSRVPGDLIPSWDLNYEASETKGWKGRQYNWGLLQGLWQSRAWHTR
jgi:hypothetical protein